jgi:hypothetical protein
MLSCGNLPILSAPTGAENRTGSTSSTFGASLDNGPRCRSFILQRATRRCDFEFSFCLRQYRDSCIAIGGIFVALSLRHA